MNAHSQEKPSIIESPHTRTILDSISDGVFTVDMDWRVTRPPLRERREAIPLLVRHFIQHFRRIRQKDIQSISSEGDRPADDADPQPVPSGQ